MAKRSSSRRPMWERGNPRKKHKKLSPAKKAKAKRRAKKAGRRYPNIVDNARVARAR
jgi:hypothetical protein